MTDRPRPEDGLDLGPERVPGRPELPGQALDRRALTPELTDRPPDRAGAQKTARGADLRVLLHERDHLADVLVADPAALAPPDPHRSAGPGRIDHLDHHPTVTSRDDSTAGATRDRITGLHLEDQARWSLRHRDQVEAGEVEQNIAPVAAAERVSYG